jgi:predicted Zn finger-like uncharacterized protein
MICPKCKTKIGIMKHEIVLDAGVIHCKRCVICGYWSEPYPTYKWQQEVRLDQAVQ